MHNTSAASTQDRWPHFEMVTFSEPTGIPNGWDVDLLRKGVPKSLLGRYDAADELTLLAGPNFDPLVCFGNSGSFVKICLDPRTGQVVDIVYDSKSGIVHSDVDSRDWLVRPAMLVNSSLDQFIASVRAVYDRFPFDSGESYDSDDNADEWDHAVEDLMKILRQMDVAAVANPDGFWRTFLDDVQMGDFSTVAVLS